MKSLRLVGVGVIVAVAISVFVSLQKAEAQVLPFAGQSAPNEEQKAAGKTVCAAVNDFTFRLAKMATKGRESGNLLISPFSVSTSHSLLLAGTLGDGKKELAGALGYQNLNDATIHNGMFALNYRAQRGEERQFRVANSFMPLDQSPIKPAFAKILRENYDADVTRLSGATPESIKKVNDWVKAKTAGMIPQAMTEFPEQARFVLLNASGFVAGWEKEFDPAKTEDGEFTTGDDVKERVPLMHLSEAEVRAHYIDDEQIDIAELPYKGKDFAMIVMLPPAKQNVWKYLGSMTARKWTAAINELRPWELDVCLPKFTFDDSFDLLPLMKSLGAKRVFDSPGALLGVSAEMPSTMVFADVQKTHIEVDEKGTRAAAVTAMPAAEAVAMPFRADRAFIYAIVHKPTGLVVFLGICSDPTKSE